MSEISSVIALGSGMYVVYWPCKGNSPLRPLFRPGAGRWPWSPGLPPQGPTLGSRNPAPVADCRSVGGGDALHIEVVGRGGEQSWGVSAAPLGIPEQLLFLLQKNLGSLWLFVYP